jgi:peptidoglycan/LPS O-acetylase OafA/YrhL
LKGRIGQLDGIRAVAIVAVFLAHTASVGMLWMGVDLFFILSGFLITGILINAKSRSLGSYFGHFYERRARRILPPYLLLLLVSSLLFGIGWARHWYLYIFLMNMLAPYGVDHLRSLNVLWSLAVEEQFYLFWPFVVYMLPEEGIAWAAGTFVVAAPILRAVCTPYFPTAEGIQFLTPFRMDTLALGALLAIAWRHHRDKITKYGVYGPVLTVLAFVAWRVIAKLDPGFSAEQNTRLSNVLTFEFALIMCGGVIVWALSGSHVGVLTWAPVRYIGRISYTLYLIHEAPLALLRPVIHSRLVVGLLAAVLTLGYAALSWHFYEQPILQGKPKSDTRKEMEAEQQAAAAATSE